MELWRIVTNENSAGLLTDRGRPVTSAPAVYLYGKEARRFNYSPSKWAKSKGWKSNLIATFKGPLDSREAKSAIERHQKLFLAAR